MGDHLATKADSREIRAKFIRHLLSDIRALEIMLEKDSFEKGIVRIGAEQEFCLVDNNWRPSVKSDIILKELDDEHFTTELARYNLEINLDPLELTGDCFSQMQYQLKSLMSKADIIARKHQSKTLVTGILPTISKDELTLEFITPGIRYKALNEMTRTQRDSDFVLHMTGVDELAVTHDSVLFEACNTSFQLHLQISPKDYINSYNWAQAIAGPVLGLCTNSPLLLGRELWSETRIALFLQSMDTRTSSYALKDQQARVAFGSHWEFGSVANIYKDDIANYKVILAKDIKKDSLAELEKGRTPKLEAINLHNGSIYRWNRPCYGVFKGKAHLRIENRYLPAGPTILDEMANFAFWTGLMMGRPEKYNDMSSYMDFRDVKANFIKAARTGKESVMHWMGEDVFLRDLLNKELLPMAYIGLLEQGIDKEDVEKLLKVIDERISRLTGAQWQVRSYRNMRKLMKTDDALLALTKAIHNNQNKDFPVAQWPVLNVSGPVHEAASMVKHIMSTQLFVIDENDPADLAINIMEWKNIHHMPVTDNRGRLSGLLTWTHMLVNKERKSDDKRTVADIMETKVITVQPQTDINNAIRIMRKNQIGCLPVVCGEDLVGIVTLKDVSAFDHG
ncbi:CBS domain-containing protein [Fulvivirga sp. 29W222]|uniref:CBS domain-containing protein n=1 Tax=Fulvivirga marina TaxID=2494733 RepID=A0A937KDQ0_9BACT|nr:CBS domain-containing protein [Fulvivirga marina]MBL6449356.1 CBS domain-containing protein [Fulvivirga marina]